MGINIYDPPFYKPPKPSNPYPGDIPSGHIILFKDASWGSESLIIDTTSGAYPAGYPFSFSGTGLQDNATWIAFNLPTGTVCTLFDNTINLASGSPPFNPAGAGVPVDLIGNGAVQTVDLDAYGANDRLSGGIWRPVDVDDGWFQLFRDTDNQGSFITIFLSEWPTNTPVSLNGWDIDGQASSVNYPSLTPPQVVVLTNQTDGTGFPLALGATNPFGTPAADVTAAAVNLTDRGINDQAHSFTYTIIEPVKAVIESVTITPILDPEKGFGVSESIVGTNYSSEPVVIATNVFENLTYTVTSTTTLQYTTAVQLTVSSQVTAGLKLSVLEASDQETITTQITTTIQDTYTKTVTTTEIFQAGQTITFTAPPSSAPVDTSASGTTTPKGAAYAAVATITLGNLQSDQDPMAQTVTTTGHFYYQENLPGSVPDPAGTGLFVLDMSITISLSGLIGTQITFDVDDISDATLALIRKKSGTTTALSTKTSGRAAKHPTPAARSHKHKKIMHKA